MMIFIGLKKRVFNLIQRHGKGISKAGDIIDLALKGDIIEKTGAWFSYGDERLGQGRDNAKNFLIENPLIKEEIEEKLYAELGLSSEKEISEVPDEDEL